MEASSILSNTIENENKHLGLAKTKFSEYVSKHARAHGLPLADSSFLKQHSRE